MDLFIDVNEVKRKSSSHEGHATVSNFTPTAEVLEILYLIEKYILLFSLFKDEFSILFLTSSIMSS